LQPTFLVFQEIGRQKNEHSYACGGCFGFVAEILMLAARLAS
jgi:hypothetical protein